MSGIAAGCDGIIVEVHNDPPHAKCDGQQSLTPDQFEQLMGKIKQMANLMGKTVVNTEKRLSVFSEKFLGKGVLAG